MLFCGPDTQCNQDEISTARKCYFIPIETKQISWYRARQLCSDKNMDLVTLASDHEVSTFLSLIESEEISSIYLSATVNSPEVISGGDAKVQWNFPRYESQKMGKAIYIQDVYGIHTWWWHTGRAGLTIQSQSSFGRTACLKLTTNRLKNTSRDDISTDTSNVTNNVSDTIHVNSASTVEFTSVNCKDEIRISLVC